MVAARVAAARAVQNARYEGLDGISINAAIEGDVLEQACNLSAEAAEMLAKAVERFRLSARAFHRIQRVGRTIADLRGDWLSAGVLIGGAYGNYIYRVFERNHVSAF